MKNISEVAIMAIQYLSERTDSEYTEEDDLKIIENAAAILLNATAEEKDMLKTMSRDLGFPDWADHIGLE